MHVRMRIVLTGEPWNEEMEGQKVHIIPLYSVSMAKDN